MLPVTTLTLAYLADYSLIMRSSLLDELGEDYLDRAGQGPARHRRSATGTPSATRCCPPPPSSALSIGFVVSGAITIETVFSIRASGC